jgi:hypothetical protein
LLGAAKKYSAIFWCFIKQGESKMKAILVGENQALSWSEVPNPVIKSEEVLVEIHYAALTEPTLCREQGIILLLPDVPNGWDLRFRALL